MASATCSASFKEAYNKCLDDPPHNIWLEFDKYLKFGHPQNFVQDLLDEHTNLVLDLKLAYQQLNGIEEELAQMEYKLNKATSARYYMNRITVSSDSDEDDVREKYSYIEKDQDEIQNRIRGLSRSIVQCRQRLFFGRNVLASLQNKIDRYTCFVGALSSLKRKHFPISLPDDDGLIIGWLYKIPIGEPDFEFEAELREANYQMEVAELQLIPTGVHGFVDSATGYMLVCRINGLGSSGDHSTSLIVNYGDWTEISCAGIDLDLHTLSYSAKGWRIMSERGKRHLRRIIRHQFLIAHQSGIFRLAIDMAYFAINLIDPTTVIELYRLYSYLFAQLKLKEINICLPDCAVLGRYYKHLQKYFERLSYREDLERSLLMHKVAEERNIPVWKLHCVDDADVILEDNAVEDNEDRNLEDNEVGRTNDQQASLI